MQRRPARVGSGDVDAKRLPVVIELSGEGTSVPEPSAPAVSITSGPSGTVESTEASFAFTSDTAGSSFECRLVDAAFASCTSPFELTGLADGDYTVEVRATVDGLTGEPAARSWTVQSAAPDVGLLAADPDSVLFGQVKVDETGEASTTLSNVGESTLSVSGVSIEGSATFTVTSTFPIELGPGASADLDVTFQPVTAGAATAVLAIEHTGGNSAFEVALSGEGISVTAPPAPVVTITSGPSGTIESADASFAFISDPVEASFECRLVDEAFASCTSPFEVTALAAGDYTFEVRATSDGVSGEPASQNFTVATPDPGTDPTPGPAPAGCHVVSGDWNGSGRDGLGWWCDGRAKLRTSGGGLIEFTYGRAGDIPIVADWNGNGRDSLSVIRDGTWHVNNRLRGGAAERTFVYGRVSRGDVPITGAWDRGVRDLPGIVRDREWHLRKAQSGGDADWRFVYGRLTAGDLPLVGDWNGDGGDTVGVVRKGEWLLRNRLAGGGADRSYVYGRVNAGDVPLMGDWTGNGVDTPAIVRDGRWHLKFEHGGGGADQVITFGAP